MKTIYEQTKLIAHRGFSDRYCENTYASFLNACQKDFYGIETDIQFTLDNKIVCFHDRTLKRLSGEKTKISEIKYKDLKKKELSVPKNRYTKHLICPFTLYLKLCKRHNKHCVIEIKGHPKEYQLEKLLKLTRKNKCLNNCIFISFNSSALIYIRERHPHVKLQLLISQPLKRYTNFCIKNNIDVSFINKLVSKDLISKLNQKGINVSVWVVNNKDEAQKFINDGIEHITSNVFM